MVIEEEKAEEIRKEFEEKYLRTGPISTHESLCFLTNRYIVERKKRGWSTIPREIVMRDLLNSSEDPNELWIEVVVYGALPDGFDIPEIFQGIKIYLVVEPPLPPKIYKSA